MNKKKNETKRENNGSNHSIESPFSVHAIVDRKTRTFEWYVYVGEAGEIS